MVVQDGARTIVGVAPEHVLVASGEDAFRALDQASRGGFWSGFIAYDLGRAVEHVVARTSENVDGGRQVPDLPDIALARYDARLVLEADAPPRVEGDGATAELLAQAAWRAQRGAGPVRAPDLGPWESSLDRDAHAAAVAEILGLLAAGECYQVNLTRRLTAPQAADPRALYRALATFNPAPHLALCSFGPALEGVAVVSASPELFLRIDGRAVETKPIKGTDTDPVRLAGSAKDRAENVMIVDLARNDLGRVCEYGSVTVPALCTVEAHPGLHHLVSTVRGRLRPDVGLADVVRATFPPASVTGAPKPRVMQAIEDLEPVRRGVYCGAVGWIDGDRGCAELAVAIRTFTIAGGHTQLGIGGGIIADSRAEAEWDETELKGARLLLAASQIAGSENATGSGL